MAAWRRKEIIWKHKQCPDKTRLMYWSMTIKTKLMYGLYLMALTQSQARRLNALQNKGLRKILNVKTTYIDRRNTVESLFLKANNTIKMGTKQATRALNEQRRLNNQPQISRPTPPPLIPLTREHERQHINYIAHLLREHHTAPTRAAAFNSAGQYNIKPKARVGGMRNKWTEIGFAKAWEKALPRYIQITGKTHLQNKEYDTNSEEHRRCISTMAVGRFA